MKRSLFALVLAAALPLSAQAGELSYTYVEGGYVNQDFGSGLGTYDGYNIGGSYNFADTGFYVAGNYEAASGQSGPFDIDLDRGLLGFGYHHSVTDNADFVVQADYADLRESTPFGDFSENGYRVSAGFRGTVTEKLELGAMARYEHLSGTLDSSNTTLDVQAQYKFNETLGLVGGVEIGKRYEQDVVVYNLGLRASF